MLSWNIANIIQSMTRVCVPLFFMISGYLFMQNKEVKTKNILKVMVNLVFYTVVYFIYVYFFRNSVIGQLPFDEALLTVFK